jgi:hypothetical protein
MPSLPPSLGCSQAVKKEKTPKTARKMTKRLFFVWGGGGGGAITLGNGCDSVHLVFHRLHANILSFGGFPPAPWGAGIGTGVCANGAGFPGFVPLRAAANGGACCGGIVPLQRHGGIIANGVVLPPFDYASVARKGEVCQVKNEKNLKYFLGGDRGKTRKMEGLGGRVPRSAIQEFNHGANGASRSTSG